ncbi:unnamed protein product [Gadus morhua 'NCC']
MDVSQQQAGRGRCSDAPLTSVIVSHGASLTHAETLCGAVSKHSAQTRKNMSDSAGVKTGWGGPGEGHMLRLKGGVRSTGAKFSQDKHKARTL